MRLQLPSFLRRISADERGLALIEISALAPFLALLTVGVIDLTSAITERMKVHHALHRTLELVTSRDIVMKPSESGYNFDYLKPIAAQAAGVDASAVTVTAWRECDGVEQSVYEGVCPDVTVNGKTRPGVVARYLQLHIDSEYEPMFLPLGEHHGAGHYFIYAESAVRIQ